MKNEDNSVVDSSALFALILKKRISAQGREKDAKITVYKKTDETYMLKMKHSREFFSSLSKKFGNMPFTLRAMENETKAKLGVVECVTHKLVEPFQVLYEKEGEENNPNVVVLLN